MRSPGRGQIAILAIPIALLVLVIIWAISAWNSSAGVAMGKHGWIALILGTVFSLVIGCGLMALMFFSSRSGYDEVADPLRHAHDQDESARQEEPDDRTTP
jgi:flagellar basal body-associated protein FliL